MEDISISVVIMVALVMSAGCSMLQDDGQRYLDASPIADVPEDAQVVPAGNETIQNSPKLRELVEEAKSTDGAVQVKFSESEADDVDDSLSKLPNYDGGDGPAGYYIEVEGEVYLLDIIIEQ